MAADSKQKALSIARSALDKSASDVLVLEVEQLTSIADYFVIASGESERQVKAIANHIGREMSKQYGSTPLMEGAGTSMWILLDFGDIVVHVFKTDIRQYYALEKMWSDAPRIPIPEHDQNRPQRSSYPSVEKTTPLVAQLGN